MLPTDRTVDNCSTWPDQRNAFDPPTCARVVALLRQADAAVRCIVLAGAGKNFCSGGDITHMREARTLSQEENRRAAQIVTGMFDVLYRLGKPTIACVHGPVRGGGIGLAAACDVAVAADSAYFQLSEVRIGMVPAMLMPLLVGVIGERQARRLLLTGESFDAAEAKAIGLIHRVVPEEELDAAIADIVANIHRGGPEATRITKATLRAYGQTLADDYVARAAETIASIRVTPEAQEGIGAFLEKRSPGWSRLELVAVIASL